MGCFIKKWQISVKKIGGKWNTCQDVLGCVLGSFSHTSAPAPPPRHTAIKWDWLFKMSILKFQMSTKYNLRRVCVFPKQWSGILHKVFFKTSRNMLTFLPFCCDFSQDFQISFQHSGTYAVLSLFLNPGWVHPDLGTLLICVFPLPTTHLLPIEWQCGGWGRGRMVHCQLRSTFCTNLGKV